MRAGRVGICPQDGYEWLGIYRPTHTPEEFQAIYDTLTQEEQEIFDRVCSNLPCAREYFESHADQYGWSEVMLARARVYTPQRLVPPIPYFPHAWHCFGNSFDEALEGGELRYVEGIAVNPVGAMPHAWLTSDGSNVFDFTWPYQHVNKYFGLELNPRWMLMNDIPAGFVGYLHNAHTPMSTPRVSKAEAEKWSRIFDAEFKDIEGA